MAAASALFFERGITATTMDSVADRAAVSKMTVYAHFADKPALLAAVFDRNTKSFRLPELSGGADLESSAAHLNEFGERLVAFLTRPEILKSARMMAESAEQYPDLAKAFYLAGPAAMLAKVTAFLRSLVEHGQLVIEDSELAAEQLTASWLGLSQLQQSLGVAEPLTAEAISPLAWRGSQCGDACGAWRKPVRLGLSVAEGRRNTGGLRRASSSIARPAQLERRSRQTEDIVAFLEQNRAKPRGFRKDQLMDWRLDPAAPPPFDPISDWLQTDSNSHQGHRMTRPSLPPGNGTLGSFAIIAGVVAVAAGGFAYTAGWLSPDRITPTKIVAALAPPGGPAFGHRRNHAKGICFTGAFEANNNGAELSRAQVFASGQYPALGRFNPRAPSIRTARRTRRCGCAAWGCRSRRRTAKRGAWP